VAGTFSLAEKILIPMTPMWDKLRNTLSL
jgi:hypothetical protein